MRMFYLYLKSLKRKDVTHQKLTKKTGTNVLGMGEERKSEDRQKTTNRTQDWREERLLTPFSLVSMSSLMMEVHFFFL